MKPLNSIINLQRNFKHSLFFIVCFGISFSFLSCKKEKGINQLDWQNESLRLTADLCKKFRECADQNWKPIPENLQKFTEGRLEEAICQKRFRESNAYKLIGADPLQIQTSYRECHKQGMDLTCDDLQAGKLMNFPSCTAFQRIQNR